MVRHQSCRLPETELRGRLRDLANERSRLGYQTPAAFAGALAATGSDATLIDGLASLPVAQPAPYGLTETAEALIAAG